MTPKNTTPEKCSKCGKIPTGNKKSLSVTCDCCKIFLCGDCHGLSPTEIRVLELKTVARVMTLLCGDCKLAMAQMPNIMKKLDLLTEEVKQLRVRQSVLATEAAIQEMMERKHRATNIIIFDVAESTSKEPIERIDHDKVETSKIINSVTRNVDCNGIETFRLGALKENTAGPRPLKVVLKSKVDAIQVLKNKGKLPNAKKIKSDLTPLQRDTDSDQFDSERTLLFNARIAFVDEFLSDRSARAGSY
ncbi:hypothetical protein NE865_12650 [Phthorimaea operculella]|nr:hypothetical protein NE865_12650 [Phthorimaea operculella]